MNYPPILEETMARTQGLILLAGLRQSGVEETARLLLKKAQGRSMKVLSDPGTTAPDSADILWLEGDFDSERLNRAVSWSEEGRLVLITQKSPSAITALRRFLSLDFGTGRRHLVWRLCDQILLMAGQMKINGITAGETLEAFEILLMTPSLREALQEENFLLIEEYLKAGDETSGTVSFNQSLLQLLLRRKIDIKTAFEVSRDPVSLDQILKKVGI